MYKQDINSTINETLQGLSALSPDSREIPEASTIHSYVSDQIGILLNFDRNTQIIYVP